jgi:hypothetical protein
MANNANQAKKYLVYYFRLLAKKSGVGWDSDNEGEIAMIVDFILAAAADEVRAQKDDGDAANEALDDYRYRRAQAEAWAKAERGE